MLPLLLAALQDQTLFDFENPEDLKVWTCVENEPPARLELSTEHVSSGKRSLKITFSGGRWPAVATTAIPEDWVPFQTFRADVTVSRPCLVGFTVLQEKSSRKGGWDEGIKRWVKTELVRSGRNEIVASLHPYDYSAIKAALGKAVSFEIFMYSPHPGESIWVDNVRVSTKKEPIGAAPKPRFKVLGTDFVVSGVQELGKLLKDKWLKPRPRSVEEVEADFRARCERIKPDHPKAVLAVFRDGESGYTGWKDAYFSSHGPDGLTVERSQNGGRSATEEIFMRHRSPLMRADLSSIPAGSTIHGAELIVVRASREYNKGMNPEEAPNMWVAEPCRRPWEEYEVNAYEYAKDKFWKAVGGMDWAGDDPDFDPVYIAHGPGMGRVNVWDFTEAVRYWTDGRHENHGFMLHGDAHDYMRAHYRETRSLIDRPALLVVYEPR